MKGYLLSLEVDARLMDTKGEMLHGSRGATKILRDHPREFALEILGFLRGGGSCSSTAGEELGHARDQGSRSDSSTRLSLDLRCLHPSPVLWIDLRCVDAFPTITPETASKLQTLRCAELDRLTGSSQG